MGILGKHQKVIIFSIIVIFVIGIVQCVNFSYAQENGKSLYFSSKFQMIEFSDDFGIKENLTSINIDLPSPNWTITDIDVNFTSIRMGSETVIIEGEKTGSERLRGNYYEILGMQINITEPTIIYSVQIFGYKDIRSSTPSPAYVQIEGWNSGSRRPNGVIYGDPVQLNMTEGIPQWNIQKFSSPIHLSPGFYCLVLDGTGISSSDRYYWDINNDNPTSQLYMCMYDDDENEWLYRNGDVFLHKIEQKLNRSYFPSEINLTAEIDGNLYNVTDGAAKGAGNLSIKNLDFSPSESNLNILIKNNLSIDLKLNFSYHIFLKQLFFSIGSVLIRENSDNEWTVNPNFTRVYSISSIKFYYPKTWYNFTVYKNGFNFTNDLIINSTDSFILFSNSSLTNGATWLIYANSPNVDLSLNAPITQYEPNEILYFIIESPIMPGNLTILLIDNKGYEVDKKLLNINETTSNNITYTNLLSSNPNEGQYRAYVFWYNSTDAGVKSQDFSVEIPPQPFVLPPEVIFNIILIVTIILIVGISGFISAKRIRRIRNEHRQKIFNKYMDILNLKYLIVSEKNSGLTVYDQQFSGKDVESSLISGFLQAIRAFGIEITDADEESRSIKLDYQNSKILMSDFKNSRLIFLMEENPSQDFLDSITALSIEIEENYGLFLENFDGDITPLQGIKDLVEKYLHTSLIYPLKVISQNKRFNSSEKTIINRAVEIMKEKNSDYFFVSFLLTKKKGFQVRDAETILNLIHKNIFKPIM